MFSSPLPLLVMDAPRLCLQQKVKPPRFARRLPESPTDCGFSGQGIFKFGFLVFLGLLGGRAWCSCAATCWSYPGLQNSQPLGHSGLGILGGPRVPRWSAPRGAGERHKQPQIIAAKFQSVLLISLTFAPIFFMSEVEQLLIYFKMCLHFFFL